MNTKIVSHWKLSKSRAEQLGLQADIEAMVAPLVERDVSAFLTESGDLSSPLCQLLQTCFAKVSDEFDAQRWITLSNDIFVDKEAKGFWIINKEYGSYRSGSRLSDVVKEVNKLIDDKVNRWTIASESTMKCLYEFKEYTIWFK